MCYCKYCGGKIDTKDRFCSFCGKKIQYRPMQSMVVTQMNSIEKFSCQLAFLGTLFWLPLIFCRQKQTAKYYANQGLWILISTNLSIWGIHMLGILNKFLSIHILGIIFNGLYSLFFMLFVLFMLYLFISSIKSVVRIHRDEQPESIMFFEERAIIK